MKSNNYSQGPAYYRGVVRRMFIGSLVIVYFVYNHHKKDRKECEIHSLRTPHSPPRCVTASKQLNVSKLVSSSVKWKYILERDILRTN